MERNRGSALRKGFPAISRLRGGKKGKTCSSVHQDKYSKGKTEGAFIALIIRMRKKDGDNERALTRWKRGGSKGRDLIVWYREEKERRERKRMCNCLEGKKRENGLLTRSEERVTIRRQWKVKNKGRFGLL